MAGKMELGPEIVEMPDATVAFIHTSGDPTGLGPEVMKALYGAAYALKFALKKQGVEMQLDMPRARWGWIPGQETAGKLDGDWALPVPDGTSEDDLVQKDPRYPVRVARWRYGTVARVVHVGDYDEEMPTIERLAAFIDEQGYVVSGAHEEWYMSGPNVKRPKTVILYPVEKRA